jgi:hypothetical protein
LSLVGETRGLTALGSDTGLGAPFIVSVNVDDPHPAGSMGLTEAMLGLRFDPTKVTVSASDITVGELTSMGSGWQIVASVDQSQGVIGIELYSATPMVAAQGGSLVNIGFHSLAAESATTVSLVDSVSPYGRLFETLLADDQSALILTPGLVDRVFAQLSIMMSP